MKVPVFSSGAAWSRRAASSVQLARLAHVQRRRFANDPWWTGRVDDALGMYNAARVTAAENRRLDTLFGGI